MQGSSTQELGANSDIRNIMSPARSRRHCSPRDEETGMGSQRASEDVGEQAEGDEDAEQEEADRIEAM